MTRCHHTDWLQLSSDACKTSIVCQPEKVLDLLPTHVTSEAVTPSLWVFIGNLCKSIVLRDLVSSRSSRHIYGRRRGGEIHLQIDDETATSDCPHLIADGDISRPNQSNLAQSKPYKCHKTVSFPVVHQSTASEIADRIYSCVLQPFSDAYCLFSNDLGGLRAISRCVAGWLAKSQAPLLPVNTFPHLIIIIDGLTHIDEPSARARFLQLLAQDTSKSIHDRFAEVHVVSLLVRDRMPEKFSSRRLRQRLQRASDHVRQARKDARLLFKARHLNGFLKLACKHVSESVGVPFDLLTAARVFHPVAPDMVTHLSNFIKRVRTPRDLFVYAIPMLASSFFLDSYPPDAPMFDPGQTIDKFYGQACLEVARTALFSHKGSSIMMLPSAFLKLIKEQTKQYFERALADDSIDFASRLHREIMHSLRSFWMQHKSVEVCFSCLRRRPTIPLDCGHMICENCVMVFGEPSVHGPYRFLIKRCMLCNSPSKDLEIRTQPPTAGYSVLSVDGGGVRGIVALTFLKVLQDRLALPIPIFRNFRVVVGTSARGLIALGLSQGWSVDHCIEIFPKLVASAFQKRKLLGLKTNFAVDALLSFVSDCIYPAKHIDSALIEAFGPDVGLLDCSFATKNNIHVGIPVATIREPALCLFTSYNGISNTRRRIEHNRQADVGSHCDPGYHVINANDESKPVKVWEVARSASAAPCYFKPKQIPGFGTFQDSGLLRNNPIFMALAEGEALFPLVEEPNCVISLGTGTFDHSFPQPDTGLAQFFKDSAIPRGVRTFLESMKGCRDWQAVTSFGRGRSSGKYHRLDIRFNSSEPPLDAVDSMSRLSAHVLQNALTMPNLDNITQCMIASFFYFELRSQPQQVGDRYAGEGIIRCLLHRDDPGLRILLERLSKMPARLHIGGSCIIDICESDSVDDEGNFAIPCTFFEKDRFEVILEQDQHTMCAISRSPVCVEKWVVAQRLAADSGTADHHKRKQVYHDPLMMSVAKRRRLR